MMSQRTALVEGIGKQTHHQKCTHHEFLPFFNLLVTSDAKINPTPSIFGLLSYADDIALRGAYKRSQYGVWQRFEQRVSDQMAFFRQDFARHRN